MIPRLYLKIDGQDEVDVSKVIPGLRYLGDDESPVIINNYQQNPGQDGELLTSINYDKSVVNAKFLLSFGNWYDFKLLKHEVFKLFSQKKLMRIRTDTEPAIVKYVIPTTFDVTPIQEGANDAVFTIPFDNPSGYKYSKARSDEDLSFVSDNWQMGMNFPSSDDISYTHSESNFRIFNASDIAIDPYYQNHDLRLVINFNGNSIKVTNTTTDTAWTYNQPAKKSDKIILDGIATTLNGSPASNNTDFGNLVLDPGWNNISVTGATDFNIVFSFPFIYIG